MKQQRKLAKGTTDNAGPRRLLYPSAREKRAYSFLGTYKRIQLGNRKTLIQTNQLLFETRTVCPVSGPICPRMKTPPTCNGSNYTPLKVIMILYGKLGNCVVVIYTIRERIAPYVAFRY